MSYKISTGMPESELSAWLADARKKYGLYENNGVNYKDAPIAPIVLCVLACNDEFLLLKRGYGLADAEGYWSVITGFIDTDVSVKEITKIELQEELGLDISVDNIKVGTSYTLQNPVEKRQYIVFPCLVRVTAKPPIVLDREHTEFTWITRNQLEQYHILDDLPHAIDQALSLELD